MKISYIVTIEDIVAFNRYHMSRSPAAKTQLVLGTVAVPLAAVVVLLVIQPPDIVNYVVTAAIAGLWAVLFPAVWPLLCDAYVRQLFREGANKGLVGCHELELAEDRLLERTDVGETVVKFEAIDRIEETPAYLFIYLSAMMAHVVPRAALSAGDLDSFTATLKNEVARRRC